ncbi:DUF262 domain-containing protein [Longimicrobium sp.]|uniref:DUF262 domain-containing protein n=1 Tax=Longimicrobium sp. TaxID=2029185 RepID=UPI002B710EF9|nr:DUF262 domain-containing protein [Longimicrobium sp.]HSU14908.1 DUF262 domain-containing protein [Longimicrobium sp.]
MRTAATNKKVRELISLVREGKLIPRPEFQRRLVWTHKDKDRFLDTVLRGLPFPEIYVADGDVDLQTGAGTQLLVDGLQRVSTLIQYFEADPDLKLVDTSSYKGLTEDEKLAFLQYDVAVRDLGAVSRAMIVEVFKRINATKYSLTDIEINNAVYAGALKQYAGRVAESEFFKLHDVFTSVDYKRMGDLRFALTVICTLLVGYFNRDDALEELLSRYNDEFSIEDETDDRIQRTFSFIDECGFDNRSRAWKKADLFTLIAETDRCLSETSPNLQPSFAVDVLTSFYSAVERSSADGSTLPSIYYKAALQASNDRVNRLRRGIIVGGLLEGQTYDGIYQRMLSQGLIKPNDVEVVSASAIQEVPEAQPMQDNLDVS